MKGGRRPDANAGRHEIARCLTTMHTPCLGGEMAEGSGFRIQATHLLACTYSYIYSPELPPSAALPLYFRCKIVAFPQPSPCQTVAFPQYIAGQSLLIGALTTRRGTAESFDDARAPDQRERGASRRRFRSRAGCGVTAGSASPSALILRKSVVLWTPSSRAAAARLPPRRGRDRARDRAHPPTWVRAP